MQAGAYGLSVKLPNGHTIVDATLDAALSRAAESLGLVTEEWLKSKHLEHAYGDVWRDDERPYVYASAKGSRSDVRNQMAMCDLLSGGEFGPWRHLVGGLWIKTGANRAVYDVLQDRLVRTIATDQPTGEELKCS